MGTQSELVAIPYERSPELRKALKIKEELNPSTDRFRFLQPNQVVLTIEGKRQVFTNTDLTDSASLLVMSLGPDGIWYVLAKKESKAFLHMQVLTAPGGYMNKEDRQGFYTRTARRKMKEETGLDLADLDLWRPNPNEASALVNLDFGVYPHAYPNNTGAAQASFMVILKGKAYIDEDRQSRDSWCFVPAFPSDASRNARAEWYERFNPHGIMANGLLRARDWLQSEGFATYDGHPGPNWVG